MSTWLTDGNDGLVVDDEQVRTPWLVGALDERLARQAPEHAELRLVCERDQDAAVSACVHPGADVRFVQAAPQLRDEAVSPVRDLLVQVELQIALMSRPGVSPPAARRWQAADRQHMYKEEHP